MKSFSNSKNDPDYRKFLSYKDQAYRLEHKYNLKINNLDEVKNILSIFPYYDLVNGYKSCLMENEKYIDNIDLIFLYNFHIYITNIHNVYIKYIMYIENIYKTRLAYTLSNCIGDHHELYLNKNEYSGSDSKDELINTIYNLMENTKDNPTKHYRSKPNIPPWILFKNISFSQAISLSSYLINDTKADFFNNIIELENKEINYDEKINFVITSIGLIRTYRNKYIHHLNGIDYKHDAKYSPSKTVIRKIFNNPIILSKKDIGENKRGFNDTYCLILCIYLYLENEYLRNKFIEELEFNLSCNGDKEKEKFFNYYIKSTNLPYNLIDRLSKL